MKVKVINGPNLDLLGKREPEVYGSLTLADLEEQIASWGARLGADLDLFQSNDEGQIVDAVHSGASGDGILINPGAFTHTSRAIADAVSAVPCPVVEVHISNVHTREPWRKDSVLDGVATRTIFGRGVAGYRDALRLLTNLVASPPITDRYGPHRENVADIRAPSDARAIALLIHGGFWLREYARDTIDGLAVDLAGRGFLTANLEYRRSGIGGAWPGSGHDVTMAIDYLRRDLAADLPMVLIGHSAGAYLALWASKRTVPTATVTLAAVTDLDAMSQSPGPGQHPARSLMMAGAPHRVDGVGPRFLVHGESDELVPYAQSSRVDEVDVELLPGLGHFELLDPDRDPWPKIVAWIESALG